MEQGERGKKVIKFPWPVHRAHSHRIFFLAVVVVFQKLINEMRAYIIIPVCNCIVWNWIYIYMNIPPLYSWLVQFEKCVAYRISSVHLMHYTAYNMNINNMRSSVNDRIGRTMMSTTRCKNDRWNSCLEPAKSAKCGHWPKNTFNSKKKTNYC